ncbi:hypothetical protein PIB30_098098 [Stylosanthes scabra]|uniref:Uncharacterized protein n=1 Tax=Stylosanthes scabra TaxID=79078 RepID=A0ABU6XYX9_9FABA|nr:hypothetical protein [Stylosanthes scabra]
MKKGSLQNKKQSLGTKQSKNSTHMRGRARICVLHQDSLRRGNLLILSTHMRRSPRICVGSQQAHVPESRLDKPKRDPDPHKPHSSTHRCRRPTHMHGRHLGNKEPRMTHA